MISRSIDTETIVPELVLPLEQSENVPQTIVHVIPGAEYPDVTLRPALATAGTMRLLFPSFATADAARLFHTPASTFAVDAPTMPWLPARYVPTRIGRVQITESKKRWYIDIGYQEIAP